MPNAYVDFEQYFRNFCVLYLVTIAFKICICLFVGYLVVRFHETLCTIYGKAMSIRN